MADIVVHLSDCIFHILQISRVHLESLSVDDLDSMSIEGSKSQVPKSYLHLLVLVARLCDLPAGGTASLLSTGDAATPANDSSLLERVMSRPSGLVRSAIGTMKAMAVPHVYSDTYGTLISRLKRNGTATAIDVRSNVADALETIQDVEKIKLRLLTEDAQNMIQNCVDYINSRMHSLMRDMDEKELKKLSSSQKVILAICKWVMALHKASELVKFNKHQNYVSTAGVLQLYLAKHKMAVSDSLNRVMATPSQLHSMHFINPSIRSHKRKGSDAPSKLFQAIMETIWQSSYGTDTNGTGSYHGYTDIRTKPFLLCLQHSKASVLQSYFEDTISGSDVALLQQVIHVNAEQVREQLQVHHAAMLISDDALGLENLIARRCQLESNLHENGKFLKHILRYFPIIFYYCLNLCLMIVR